MAQPSASSKSLLFPPGLRYHCHQCGACCRDTWEIRVEPEAVDRVAALHWRDCSCLDPTEKSPFEPSPSVRREKVLRRVEGACHFLGENNLCRLHAKYDFETKPHTCRRFPFSFVEGPEGVHVGLSFACEAVRNQTGLPIEEQREEIQWIFDHAPAHTVLSLPVRLDARTTLEWKDYQQVEQTLSRILSRKDASLRKCLVAGHAWLGMLRQMLAMAAYQASQGQGRQSPSDVVRYYVEKTAAGDFDRAFAIAERPVAHRTLKRMVLGTFLGFRQSLRPSQTRLGAILRVALENARHWARIGSLRLMPLPDKIPWSAFSPEAALLETEEAEDLLRRYFLHALQRKDLIAHTDVFWGYNYFLLTWGIVEYYASGLQALEKPDIGRALELVEKHFVHHSSFNQTFLYHPGIAHLFQYLFERPNFAHTLLFG